MIALYSGLASSATQDKNELPSSNFCSEQEMEEAFKAKLESGKNSEEFSLAKNKLRWRGYSLIFTAHDKL